MSIKHAFVSAIPDEGVSGKVSPSRWNADHTIDDGTLAATKLTAAAQAFLVPSGGIIMWSGSIATIPSGWYLCNGANGTPDLRDKFVVGASQDDAEVAKTNIEGTLKQSAAPTHVHSQSIHAHSIPSHSHVIAAHTHTLPFYIGTSRIAWDQDGAPNPFGSSLDYAAQTCERTLPSDSDSTPDTLTYAVSKQSTLAATEAVAASGTGDSTATNTGATSPIPTYYALAFIQKS